jgi:hypothetical protein
MPPDTRNDPAGGGAGSGHFKAGGLLVSSVPAGSVTATEACRRRDRIKLLLTSITEKANKLQAILQEARTNEDHLALGYASWTAYMAGEYAGLLAELTRANRREVVGSLTSAGMPTRAIAEIVGVDHSTVVRDQKQVVHPAPPDREHCADRRVTGLDGKLYSAPSRPVVEPRKPRRSSLPDQYRGAVFELEKAVRRLEKLHADDRFAGHRAALSHHHALLLELADKVGLFAIQVSGEHADQVYVEMFGGAGGDR